MLKEITMFEFNDFAQKHNLYNPYQTSNYAIFKTEENFDYEYLGFFENNTLTCATLILYKNVSFTLKYAYSPRGFLMDYKDITLLKEFSTELKKYLKKKRVVFLKIDPLIITKKYNAFDKQLTFIEQLNYKNIFSELDYRKLKDNLYFEASLPRFDGIINLKEFNLKNIQKNTRNKINKAINKGLNFRMAEQKDLPQLYEFIKNKSNKKFKYYNDLYKAYNSDALIDFFLVEIDYEAFLEKAKSKYEEETVKNNNLNEELKINSSNKILNKKMVSDKLLINYKNDILEASSKYSNNELKKVIAGALVIKSGKNVSIICSGYNPRFRHLNANYFLHYSIIEHYKEDYEYLSLNGLTGDFSKENKYYGLNEFKLSFNPIIIEYLGELDLIINEKAYNNLLTTGKLHNIFDKKD